MAKPAAKSSLLLLLLLLFVAFAAAAAAAAPRGVGGAEGSGISVGWFPSLAAGGCRGSTIGDCLDGAEEGGLDVVGARRMLGTSDYISYDALKRDSTPCSQAGASYYNCRPGAEANPYARGCSSISNCRS